MVGGAMLQAFREHGVQVVAYDRYKPGFDDESVHFEALIECPMIFVSVPTKTNENGTQDLGPIEDVLARLKSYKYTGIVVSKCTTLPGITKTLSQHYDMRMVHYPEFLRAAHAYEDFKFQKVALVSSPNPQDVLDVATFLRETFPKLTLRLFDNFASTEIAKYVNNCFLATQISFLNEMYDVCEYYRVNYQDIIDGLAPLKILSKNHTKVPGSDGKRGWDGYCFPKDLKAFIYRHDLMDLNVIKATIDSNSLRRK